MSDPGISEPSSRLDSTQRSNQFQDHGTPARRLNAPLALPPARDRRAAARSRGAHPRWSGGAISGQRARELADLRTFERLAESDELPAAAACLSASTLVGIVNAGKAAPFERMRNARAIRVAIASDGDRACEEPGRIDCACCSHGERAFRARCQEALAWIARIAVAPIGGCVFDWLIARHADMAALIGCCETLAARVMRHLHQHHYVRRVPLYAEEHITLPDGKRYRRHVRGPSAYAIAPRALELAGVAIVIPKYQASENQSASSGSGTPLPGEQAQRRRDRQADALIAPVSLPTPAAVVPDVATMPATPDERVKARPAAPHGSGRQGSLTPGGAARALLALHKRQDDELALVQRNERRRADDAVRAERIAIRKASAQLALAARVASSPARSSRVLLSHLAAAPLRDENGLPRFTAEERAELERTTKRDPTTPATSDDAETLDDVLNRFRRKHGLERDCTCTGSCKGADGLAPGWRCALEDGGDQ